MKVLAKIGIAFLNFVYFFYKQFPVRNQIIFLSRQNNQISVDYRLLKERLNAVAPYINIVEIYEMIPKSYMGKIKYSLDMIRVQMFALATSRIVVLDGYSIAVSVLKHKKSLKIVQMWHAMGSLKRFGYAAIGSAEGSNMDVARVFRMHKNYDYILSSSEKCILPLSRAFGNPKDKFVVMSLPRTDLITDKVFKMQMKECILKKYPEVCEKKNILYVPTFRKNSEMLEAIEKLIESIDYTKYNLIIKLHPLMKEKIDLRNVLTMDDFTSLDLLSIADYVVTDYSAFIFEAAVAGVPIISYAFDYDEYKNDRGFLIDFENEIPTRVCRTANEVVDLIDHDRFDLYKIKQFAKKYITHQEGCTQMFVDFLLSIYEGKESKKNK